ncbi:ABC transporter substrate-binding protein [Piscinibacter gummiphilus]|uniref:ABC transporter substrate-binding protein n=1 Tax=Piscinibacter gummiphilus TaxID=946333 RepID=A0ABZ0CN04_9BURK|nr:ABC transporter substrate-binding protein [Piscinibacter gummiphilus]WOB05901.1 ABC transporter substrate-binding protein [Piscinibacter gummiphilus]
MLYQRIVLKAAAALAMLLCALAARADIVIGQTSGFTGQVKGSVEELSLGAKLYLDFVNAGGGVNGQRIRLVQLDDKFDPRLAAANAEALIVKEGALALFLTRGTPHTQAVLPHLAKHRVPLIAPSTGAMVLHQPPHPYVFNVRATYQREAMRAIEHLGVIGLSRVAVLHVKDSFGADAVLGALKGFENIGKSPVVVHEFERENPAFSGVASKVMHTHAQAVLIIGSATAVVDATKAIRTAGSSAQIVTLSNNASGAFIKQMGENARGTIVTQVFPYERASGPRFVRHALELAKGRGNTELSPAMLEGFAAAKVLVEAIKRAGRSPTRASLLSALEGMQRLDIGGLELSYSPTDHTGFDFVDLSIIAADGRFTR